MHLLALLAALTNAACLPFTLSRGCSDLSDLRHNKLQEPLWRGSVSSHGSKSALWIAGAQAATQGLLQAHEQGPYRATLRHPARRNHWLLTQRDRQVGSMQLTWIGKNLFASGKRALENSNDQPSSSSCQVGETPGGGHQIGP